LSPGELKIRRARLDDAPQISDIHRSHVERWYRKIDAEQYEVPYGSLSLSERWGFGGPWMSAETCSIHLNNLLLQRQFPLVAERGKKLIGEMELFSGKEGSPYDKNMHIGLLYVKKGYTDKGTGKALVDKARDLAAEQECDTLTVASSQAKEGFYEKCGFEHSGNLVELEAMTGQYGVNIKRSRTPLNAQSFAHGKSMPVGRYQSSAFHLFEMNDAYALPEFLNCRRERIVREVNGHPTMFAFVKYDTDISRADVYCWTDGAKTGDIVYSALTLLHKDGIKYATILLAKEDYDVLADNLDAAVKGSRSSLCMKVDH